MNYCVKIDFLLNLYFTHSMYKEVDKIAESCGIIVLFTTWLACFNKILDTYDTFQREKMICPDKPRTDKLKKAVYAASLLNFDFSRNHVGGTHFTRYCAYDCNTIVSPTYRMVKNIKSFSILDVCLNTQHKLY